MRVGARVHLDIAARRERRLGEQRGQVGRLGVAQRTGEQLQLARERLLVAELPPLGLLVREHAERRDAHDGAVDAIAQFVILQNDVERLIPRHFVQRHVDRALHRLIDDDVEAADVGERAEHRPQIGALEVERDGMAVEPRLAAGDVAGRRLGGSRRRGRPGRRLLRQRGASRPAGIPGRGQQRGNRIARPGHRRRRGGRLVIRAGVVEEDLQVLRAFLGRHHPITGRPDEVHRDLRMRLRARGRDVNGGDRPAADDDVGRRVRSEPWKIENHARNSVAEGGHRSEPQLAVAHQGQARSGHLARRTDVVQGRGGAQGRGRSHRWRCAGRGRCRKGAVEIHEDQVPLDAHRVRGRACERDAYARDRRAVRIHGVGDRYAGDEAAFASHIGRPAALHTPQIDQQRRRIGPGDQVRHRIRGLDGERGGALAGLHGERAQLRVAGIASGPDAGHREHERAREAEQKRSLIG